MNVPTTAQKVPQPRARIAKLDPASNSRTFSITPFSTSTCSCRFEAANVLLNPAIAATPATDARNIPAIILMKEEFNDVTTDHNWPIG